MFLTEVSCNEEIESIYRHCSTCLALQETCQQKITKERKHLACLALQKTTLLVLHFKKQPLLVLYYISFIILSNMRHVQYVYFEPTSTI